MKKLVLIALVLGVIAVFGAGTASASLLPIADPTGLLPAEVASLLPIADPTGLLPAEVASLLPIADPTGLLPAEVA